VRACCWFRGVDLGGGGVDAAGESGDFLFEASLLRIHEGDAAGEDDAQRARNSSRTAAKRSALAAWRLSEFIWRDFFKDVSTRARFCLRFRGGVREAFLVLKRVMPAASSMMARRSCGLELRSWPMRSWR